jgi:hypothetical protein
VFIPPLDYNRENNFGALELGRAREGEEATVVALDSLQLPRCDLLKVDVEGMELNVLKGAAATLQHCRPALYVKNDRAASSAALIEYLLASGYDLYWHLPPLFNPRNYYHTAENRFGAIVSKNMLGVPASAKSSIVGLQRILGPQDELGKLFGGAPGGLPD